MSYFWKKMYRDLKEGDIIRTIVSNKFHQDYDNYWYAIASGDGFGSRINTIGNAIFVIHQSKHLHEIIERKRIKYLGVNETGRWERSWGIEILEVGEE